MKIFVTSDTHYGHANIIKYCKRPFLKPGDLDTNDDWTSRSIARQRANEHDEVLITNHNAVVSPEDTVYHLGDVVFGRTEDAIRIIRRLNGNFKFIRGNHDRTMDELKSVIRFYPDLKDRVEFLGDYYVLNHDLGEFVMFHYPILVWDKAHHGAFCLCGHSHGTCPQSNPNTTTSRLLDVGVDTHNFTPWSLSQIETLLSAKAYKSFDHH